MFSIEELKLIKEELKINEDKYSEEIIKEKKLKDPIKNIIKEYE